MTDTWCVKCCIVIIIITNHPRGRPRLSLIQQIGRSITTVTQTHTHPFNGPLSGITRVSRYQKGKTNLDFTEARDSEWQWHQLGHMQTICTCCRQKTTPATPTQDFFYRLDAIPVTQSTASKMQEEYFLLKALSRPYVLN